MKILKIEFSNINSLKGPSLIDFTAEPFTHSSLFAITGPTGSGKSTILDVISLALFNHVPRLGKISRNEILSKGAILTRNQKEAFAKVTYESKTGIYTSHWNISTARTGNLREYEMEIINESSGAILDLKKSDVPAKNEELIGLNYNQFIKSVLLAQGEFAQFLKAKKDERGELLEKITGTGIYRQLGKMAWEKHKLVNAEIQKQQDEIGVITKDLLEEERLLELSASYKEKEESCKPLEEEIRKLEKNVELKNTIEQQLREIDKITSEKKRAEGNLKEFIEGYGLKLQQHQKVQDFAEELRDWKRLTQDCVNLDKDFKTRNTRKDENLQQLRDCLRDVSGFTQMETLQEEVEKRLEEFYNKVRKIQEELKSKGLEFKSLQQIFRTETRELACELNDKEPASTKKELEEIKTASEEKINLLLPQLSGLDLQETGREKIRIKKDLNLAREAVSLQEKIDNITAELDRLNAEEKKLLPLVKKLPLEIKEAEEKVRSCRDRVEIISLKKQNELLLKDLEEHRSHLKDGEPCPLCGATHHPFAEGLPTKSDRLDEELKEAEQEFHLWNGKLSENKTTLNLHTTSLQEINRQQESKQQELERQKNSISENYSHLQIGEETNWKNICENLDSTLESLESYEKEKRSLQCVETGLPLIKDMLQISADGKDLRVRLESIYSGKDINADSQRLQTRWTRLTELNKAIATEIGELEKKIEIAGTQLRSLENKLTSLVKEKGFENISLAGEALLPDPEYHKLYSEREKIGKDISKNSQALELLSSQLERSRAGDVQDTREALSLRQHESKGKLDTLRAECQHLNRLLVNDKENREKIHKLKTEISGKEKEIKRWRLLNELIGDSNGKKFNDFAQDLSLSQLLHLANIRLRDLSDRYLLDKPEEDEDDGLVAIDEHMGGQRRSVKTLSGGETFLLSLSMALALSDLASRNVEINSLFIDEGFGTLDPETLDQTLDTLEKLQAESSKTIGIISHVDSLKERIATQIQLTRNGQGYSSLSIK
ncbi:MAG TPA: AAA family ATPase [Gillisia sp.]|nr:AAA family ATPase [Gillisia sp.]